MRKILLGLAATAAIAAPIAVAGSASANTPGTLDTTTHADGTSYVHHFAADYTCGVSGDHAIVNFTITGVTASGSGTGVLTPDTQGGGTFAFTGENNGYKYSYGGAYGANGVWTQASATADDGGYNFGTDGTKDGFRGSVDGSFSDVPPCPTPEVPATVTGNHGEYVSGAAKAGVKGTDLA